MLLVKLGSIDERNSATSLPGSVANRHGQSFCPSAASWVYQLLQFWKVLSAHLGSEDEVLRRCDDAQLREPLVDEEGPVIPRLPEDDHAVRLLAFQAQLYPVASLGPPSAEEKK